MNVPGHTLHGAHHMSSAAYTAGYCSPLHALASTCIPANQQVLKSQLEHLQKQRREIEGDLQSLSHAFHTTTTDNQALHHQLEVR